MNRTYLIGWLIILTAGGFWEAFAVRRDAKGDTLSELVWTILSFHPVIWFASAGILVWLAIHFLTRGKV